MSRQAHVDSVNQTITQLDKVSGLLSETGVELDTLMDLMETSIGSDVRDSPGSAAMSRANMIRSDVASLLTSLVTVRTDLADYLAHL